MSSQKLKIDHNDLGYVFNCGSHADQAVMPNVLSSVNDLMGSISMGLVGVGLVTFSGLAKNGTKFKTDYTPIEILKKRLAKGEITKMEFDNPKQIFNKQKSSRKFSLSC